MSDRSNSPAYVAGRRRGVVKSQTRWAPRTPAGIATALSGAGMDSQSAFGPGTPLLPSQGYSQRPRAMDYPAGINISTESRGQWGRTSFDTLRAIIDAYDVARMCINDKIDEIRSMPLMFVAADGWRGRDVEDAVEAAKAALARPDQESSYDEWVSKLLENALRYDATPLYRRRNLGGEVIGLEVIDGPSIMPYIDENGRRPRPPAPAYDQVIHGQVNNWFTSQDLSYQRFRPQTNSPYGMAPIESILLTANTDIRFQWHFLQMFTDGSIPGGFVELPPDISSPDQVAEWQDYWDAMVSGDQAQLHKLIAVPAGTKIAETRPKAFDATFPEYLMSRTCAAYGVLPQNLGLVKDVNRANGETQVDIQFRVKTLPWVLWLKGILDRYVQRDLGLPMVAVNLDTGRDKEDRLAEAQAWKVYVETGFASMDEAREELLGLAVDDERRIPRGIITPRAGFIPLASILSIAGVIDAETAAPSDEQPLDLSPFTGPGGVMPDKSPGGPQFKRAPVNPDEPRFPELEHPVPGSDVVGMKPAAPVIGEPGVPLVKPLPASEKVTKAGGEMATFRRFVRARARAGRWRDFDFTAVEPVAAHRLNDQGRAAVRKAAGEIVVAGLAVRAANTGRVLMLQRGLDETDPASGSWEFPGGHLEDGEAPFTAACREWQEEVGCLLPASSVAAAHADYRSWTSGDGVYRGIVMDVPSEASIDFGGRSSVTNPDDPDGDIVEQVAWWDPAQLPGNPAVRAELQASVADVLNVLSDEALEVAKAAGGARPKVSNWRGAAARVPQHEFDLKITDHYAPLIIDAMRAAFPDSLLRTAISAGGSKSETVTKAVGGPPDVVAEAARAALASGANGAELEKVLRQVYADAYGAGGYAAAQQVGGAAVSLHGVSGVDWSAWVPGDPAAAALTANGGLAALLDDAGITMDGIVGSKLDQVANEISAGLGRGDSIDTIAGQLSPIVGDGSRAVMIAHTETARAMTQASLDTYGVNGVGAWDWVISEDACQECTDMAGGNPYDLASGGDEPPLHPYCRCAVSPVADSVGGTSSDVSAGGLGGGGDLVLGDDVESMFGDAGAAEEADLEALTDDDLAGQLNDAAAAGDEARVKRVVDELDRRDAAAAKQAARDAKRAAVEAEKDARFEAAVSAGDDPEQAYADIYGTTVERMRIEQAMASMRANGYTGRNFEELCMNAYQDHAELSFLKAEAETRGVLLNRAARDAGVSSRSLFTGPESRARKYASEELLSYWQRVGRLTLDDFKTSNLGGKARSLETGYFA
jgi:8-oxo-dGTP pyrophosphatase MutT (NUDIX family)